MPMKSETLETPVKRTIVQDDESKEIDRLNNEIQMLENILKTKGVDHRISSKKHLGIQEFNTSSMNFNKLRYMHSENLCPPFSKTKQEYHQAGNRPNSRRNSVKHLQ